MVTGFLLLEALSAVWSSAGASAAGAPSKMRSSLVLTATALTCASGFFGPATVADRATRSQPRLCSSTAASLPSRAALYSLLHLNGFPGDTDFYRRECAGAARVLELGAGDGRIGAALLASPEVLSLSVSPTSLLSLS